MPDTTHERFLTMLRTDCIYLVIESPTCHTYVAVSNDFGNELEEVYASAKRARLMTDREEIVSITRAEYDAARAQ